MKRADQYHITIIQLHYNLINKMNASTEELAR